MTIEVSKREGELIACALTGYGNALLNLFLDESDPEQKDAYEDAIYSINRIRKEIEAYDR